MQQQDGGPAFPQIETDGDTDKLHGEFSHVYSYGGMSLRDYFAAKAMHAELNTAGAFDAPAEALAQAAVEAGRTVEQQVAFNAYRVADAMLEARQGGRE